MVSIRAGMLMARQGLAGRWEPGAGAGADAGADAGHGGWD